MITHGIGVPTLTVESLRPHISGRADLTPIAARFDEVALVHELKLTSAESRIPECLLWGKNMHLAKEHRAVRFDDLCVERMEELMNAWLI